MIAYGNRYKQTLGVTLAECIKDNEDLYHRYPLALKHLKETYDENGVAFEWTYYSAGGGVMRLYATSKMAQSRNPKGGVFTVEVPE